MIDHQHLNLAPDQAAARIHREIAGATRAIQAGQIDVAMDCYVRSLGLALQLGPLPTQQVLIALLSGAQALADRGEIATLSAMGPALVELVDRVRQAGALPPTAVMEAWATVASDLATTLGQIGLASGLPPDRRVSLLDQARTRLALLDDATNHFFDLLNWWHELDPFS
ncbi:MAG: hypothetical protein PVF47_04910 [Anaerolineae bacterium]|jgi:hypothetical protein